MLASDDVHPAGVGNGHDLVGRFYQSHLSASAGIARFDPARTALAQDYARDRDGVYVRRRLWIPEAAQRRHRLLNTTFRTYIADPSDPAHGDGVLSAMYLAKSLVLYEYARRFGNAEPSAEQLVRHARNILASPVRLAAFAARWARYRTFSDRKLPSVVLDSPSRSYPIEFHAEQAPNPDSRVGLSAERDEMGMPRLSVDWRLTQTDVDSLLGSYRLLREAMAARAVGRLEIDEDELVDVARRRSVVGGHHIGTTRMAADPRHGVVDAHCRVHGIDNLFIAGSSVFPTSGQANPTLTVVALALRLAERLAAECLGTRPVAPSRERTAAAL
jgi:choline dehydrogenase-like flavoprotein